MDDFDRQKFLTSVELEQRAVLTEFLSVQVRQRVQQMAEYLRSRLRRSRQHPIS